MKVLQNLKKYLVFNEKNNNCATNQEVQKLLFLRYHEMIIHNELLPSLWEVGFRTYSQTDEIGILLFIFSVIGTTNKKCVEICAGDGIECNTANLIINHGFSGLLFDGNAQNIEKNNQFYRNCKDTRIYPPKLVNAWVTQENVNDLIKRNGFEGEIDLLSLDIDGVDYWIWKSIECIKPRVVVLEYQDILGPEKTISVPYEPNFNRYNYHEDFNGASLRAYVKLATEKGYHLVGWNRYGYNAFFIRNDVKNDEITKIPIEQCFSHQKVIDGMKNRYPQIKDFPWIEV